MRVLCVVMILATPLRADWGSCVTDLTRLQRAASDAIDAADPLQSQKSAFDDAKRRYESCRRDPEMDDEYADHCETLRSRAHSAEQDYRAGVERLASELGEVRSY